MKILILNGPNLNLQGHRDTDIYGTETFESYIERLRNMFPECQIEYFQSNIEGELISALHNSIGKFDGSIYRRSSPAKSSDTYHCSPLA